VRARDAVARDGALDSLLANRKSMFGLDLDLHRRVRIGVTGLNTAGKTVFLTSLIHALRHRGAIANVSAIRESRLKGVEIVPLDAADGVAAFPYQANADTIAGADGKGQRWPAHTDRISKIVLAARYAPANRITRQLGDRELRIELVDYPGEWLLDVLLARIDYATWSRALLQEMQTTGDCPEARSYLDFVDQTSAAPIRELDSWAAQAARLFKHYVEARRKATGRANRLHPGRFLLPGPGMDPDMPSLTFAPLPSPDDAGARGFLRSIPLPRGLRGNSLHRVMAERFDIYRRRVVRPFFDQTFAKLDRQVVLVDLLGHLARDGVGMPMLDDELGDLQESMRLGRSWLPRQVRPTVEKVLYASTKADLVPSDQHDVLLQRMRTAVGDSHEAARFRGADTRVMTLAALAATREVTAEDRPGRRYVAGRHPDGNAYMHDPGDLANAPADGARPSGDADGLFAVESFLPPEDLERRAPWPHTRLDRAIEFLLGDDLA
jgi:predicted YcjX-like family ATPase